jgi:hypothetical protein
MNTESEEHIQAAHRLDAESASDGMLDEVGKPETLDPEEFDAWIHSKGIWKSLYLGSIQGHPLSMFGNTFQEEASHKQALEKGNFIRPEEKGEEFATFVPEDLDGEGSLSASLTRQVVSARFAADPKLDYLIEYITHDDDNVLDSDEVRVLTDLGFIQATTIQYSKEEEELSTGFIIRRSDFSAQ